MHAFVRWTREERSKVCCHFARIIFSVPPCHATHQWTIIIIKYHWNKEITASVTEPQDFFNKTFFHSRCLQQQLSQCLVSLPSNKDSIKKIIANKLPSCAVTTLSRNVYLFWLWLLLWTLKPCDIFTVWLWSICFNLLRSIDINIIIVSSK